MTERRQKAVSAGLFGAVLHGLGGAAIGGSFDAPGAAAGAVVGAVVGGGGEGLTDWYRKAGEPKPIWWRIIAGAFFAGILGWLGQLRVGRRGGQGGGAEPRLVARDRDLPVGQLR